MAHAREAREVADYVGDALARMVALSVADDYEKRAESARQRIMGLPLPELDKKHD
jgi:hypothetical protein